MGAMLHPLRGGRCAYFAHYGPYSADVIVAYIETPWKMPGGVACEGREGFPRSVDLRPLRVVRGRLCAVYAKACAAPGPFPRYIGRSDIPFPIKAARLSGEQGNAR